MLNASNQQPQNPIFNQNPNFQSPKPRDPQKQNMTIILALLGLIVAANAAYFLIKKPVSEAVVAAVVEEKDQKYAALDSAFAAAKSELDSLRRLKPELEQRIADREIELESKRNEIANFIRSGGSAGEARQRIERLKTENQAALAQIETLKTEVSGLREKVVFIEKERDDATAQLVASGEKIAAAESQNQQFLDQKRRAETEKTALSDRLEASAFLNVGDEKAEAVMVSANDPNKTKGISSAKKADRIDIKFTIKPNELVASGPQTFFVQIQRAGETGQTLEGTTSGTESNFKYSTKTTVDYDQTAREMTAQFTAASGFEKGDYVVHIFHKGRKVGGTQFSLKK